MSDNRVTPQTLMAMEAVLPDTLTPSDMVALICTLIASYEMQPEWTAIAHETGLRLSLVARKGAKIN